MTTIKQDPLCQYKAPSEASIEGVLQDLGELCANANFGFVNRELFFTESNIGDWRGLYHEMHQLLDKLSMAVEASKYPDPVPVEYMPLRGITNGRGKVIG